MQDQHQKYESTSQFQYQKKAKEIKDQGSRKRGEQGETPDLHHFLEQKYFFPRKIGKHKVFAYNM